MFVRNAEERKVVGHICSLIFDYNFKRKVGDAMKKKNDIPWKNAMEIEEMGKV